MSVASYLATKDLELFQSSKQQDFKLYCFKPRDFWCSKTVPPISTGCEVGRYDFRGHIRFQAASKNPALQFSFIDDYSTSSRLFPSENIRANYG